MPRTPTSSRCSRPTATAECVARGAELLPQLAAGRRRARSPASGLDCAVELDGRRRPGARAAIAELEVAARRALADKSLELAADDLSGLYISLIGARDDAEDAVEKAKLLAAWIALLESAAPRRRRTPTRAPSSIRTASPPTSKLGQPERAIPMLEASERDLPGDYNPPARLAVAYQAMKQLRPRARRLRPRAREVRTDRAASASSGPAPTS